MSQPASAARAVDLISTTKLELQFLYVSNDRASSSITSDIP